MFVQDISSCRDIDSVDISITNYMSGKQLQPHIIRANNDLMSPLPLITGGNVTGYCMHQTQNEIFSHNAITFLMGER